MTPLSRIDGIMCTLYAIAVLTTLLRVYCRRFVLHAFGADDALIVIAMVSYLYKPDGVSIVSCYAND